MFNVDLIEDNLTLYYQGKISKEQLLRLLEDTIERLELTVDSLRTIHGQIDMPNNKNVRRRVVRM